MGQTAEERRNDKKMSRYFATFLFYFIYLFIYFFFFSLFEQGTMIVTKIDRAFRGP